MPYKAPIDEMKFTLRHVAKYEEIEKLPACSEFSWDTLEAALEEASKVAQNILCPLHEHGDVEGSQFNNGAVRTPSGWKSGFDELVSGGWMGLTGSTDYGGKGLPITFAAPIKEAWHTANMSLAICDLLSDGAAEAIEANATAAVKDLFLPKLLSGQWTGTMNLTEPQSGSDLASLRTLATPRTDGTYRIYGQKIFISYGEHDLTENIVHLVLARTPNAPAGVKGISLFVVPKFIPNADGSPGRPNDLCCISIERKLGLHASPTCTMIYGDKEGAVGWLVGEKNEGLKYMFVMMNQARFIVGLQGVAIGERSYQLALAHAQERVQGTPIGGMKGDPIAGHPDVARMLLTMKSNTEATRALAYLCAATLDRAKNHPDPKVRESELLIAELLVPIAKGWCTEVGNETAALCVQVHGGAGFIEETGAPQLLRDARILTIYEGTTGIQANDLVFRKIRRDSGATLTTLFATIESEIATCSSPELAPIAERLSIALSHAKSVGEWMIDTCIRRPESAASGAVAFLRLMGIVLGGWCMLRSASASARMLTRQEGPPEFSINKIGTARFFADHTLPAATGLTESILHGSGSIVFGVDSFSDCPERENSREFKAKELEPAKSTRREEAVR